MEMKFGLGYCNTQRFERRFHIRSSGNFQIPNFKAEDDFFLIFEFVRAFHVNADMITTEKALRGVLNNSREQVALILSCYLSLFLIIVNLVPSFGFTILNKTGNATFYHISNLDPSQCKEYISMVYHLKFTKTSVLTQLVPLSCSFLVMLFW